MKKSVPVFVENIGGAYMFAGPISKIVAMLNSYLEDHPDAYIETRVQDFSDDYDFCVYYDREETDEEYAARVQQDIDYQKRRMERLIAEAKSLGVRVVSDE